MAHIGKNLHSDKCSPEMVPLTHSLLQYGSVACSGFRLVKGVSQKWSQPASVQCNRRHDRAGRKSLVVETVPRRSAQTDLPLMATTEKRHENDQGHDPKSGCR